MFASIRLWALIGLLSILRVTYADSPAVAGNDPRAGKAIGKSLVSWGGVDGNAFAEYGRNNRDEWWARRIWSLAGGRIAMSVVIAEVEARLGIGMDFFAPLESSRSAQNRIVKSQLGIEEASLRRSFDIMGWPSALQGGLFRWKINPDAAMLGEYLVRYGAYPGWAERRVETWDSLGGLNTLVSGIRFSVASPAKILRQEVLVLMDSNSFGGQDFSLAHTVDAKLAGGLEIGVAWEAFRFASSDPGKLTLREWYNGYVKTDSGYVLLRDLPYGEGASRPSEDTGYYSRSALMLSGRVALDFREMLGMAPGRGREGRVFLETALLGWRNYPILYDDAWRRVALTVGAYIPTFGILDVACLQWENHPAHYGFPEYATDYEPIDFQGRVITGGDYFRAWTAALLVSKDFWSRMAVQVRIMDEPGPGFHLLTGEQASPRYRTILSRLMVRF